MTESDIHGRFQNLEDLGDLLVLQGTTKSTRKKSQGFKII